MPLNNPINYKMNHNPLTNTTILITGSAGFIASCLASYFNKMGCNKIYLVDDFTSDPKINNWQNITYIQKIDRTFFAENLHKYNHLFNLIIHLGARTDTTEFNYAIHQILNLDYSKLLWEFSIKNNIPFIYASSAATYGNGSFGYNDQDDLSFKLQPLNPYGISKNEFDKWALQQDIKPIGWAGLKFFNVYGPNEYHKNRMASVIWHAFNQIKENGYVKLFKSENIQFKDGEQLRDFIYVKDITNIIFWISSLMVEKKWHNNWNGLFNIGTGKARSFNDLVNAVFSALNLNPNIEYINMPTDLINNYQYFTEANMQKLRSIGYNASFFSLEEGIKDYVQNYLMELKYY